MKYWWIFFLMNCYLANADSLNNVYFYYDNKFVPCNWEKIATEDSVCNHGKSQSPIDIANDFLSYNKLEYFYTPLLKEQIVQNNGTALKFGASKENYILINKQKFNLIQFHIHNLNEHSIEGKNYDMEMHLVHQNKHNEFAVVGIFIKQGNVNPNIARLINFSIQSSKLAKEYININNFLPKKSKIYHYHGSLTTPPCTEGVKWFVMNKPIDASKKQIQKLRQLTKFNSRPVQVYKK